MTILIVGLLVTVVAVVVLAATGQRRDRHEIRIDQWHRACDALGSAAQSGGEEAGTSAEPITASVDEPDAPAVPGGHVRVLSLNDTPHETEPGETTPPDATPRRDRMAAD